MRHSTKRDPRLSPPRTGLTVVNVHLAVAASVECSKNLSIWRNLSKYFEIDDDAKMELNDVERFQLLCCDSYMSEVNFMFPTASIKNIKREVGGSDHYDLPLDAHFYNKKFSLDCIRMAQPEAGAMICVEVSDHETRTEVNMIFSCTQVSLEWTYRQRFMSDLIESYIFHRYELGGGSGSSEKLKIEVLPEADQMFLVKYPSWKEVSDVLKAVKGVETYRKLVKRKFYDTFNHEYGKQFEGKWYRGAFKRRIHGCTEYNPEVAVFNLIDIGRDMIIPGTHVYAITPRFLIPPQLSINISINIDGLQQYTPDLEKWLTTILIPGQQVAIRVIDSVADITMVHVIDPLLTVERLVAWESEAEESSIRNEVTGKLTTVVNNTLDLRDDTKMKEKCRTLLNEYKSDYVAELSMNRTCYGSDTKDRQYKAGGFPLIFMSMKP